MDILDPDGARERLAAWKDRIDQLAANTQAMSDQLNALRISARDQEGMSEVTIDSTGVLVDLRLTDRIEQASPDLIARTIMATLRDARAKLADRSQEIITGTMGAESATGQAVAATVGRHLRGDTQPAPDDEPLAVTEENW